MQNVIHGRRLPAGSCTTSRQGILEGVSPNRSQSDPRSTQESSYLSKRLRIGGGRAHVLVDWAQSQTRKGREFFFIGLKGCGSWARFHPSWWEVAVPVDVPYDT
jgi:hypothetical protein